MLIVNEAIHIKQKPKEELLSKMYMEQEYDHVMLHRMGFGARWHQFTENSVNYTKI